MSVGSSPKGPDLSRRHFLQMGGAVIVAFSLLPRSAVAAPSKSLDKTLIHSFLAFGADGRVTVYSGKVDLGQGLRIAIRQMAAEELGLGVDKIDLVEGDTSLTPDQGATAGSTGVAVGGVQIRQAAATARHILLTRAAARLGWPVAELDLRDGVILSANGPSVSVTDLLGGAILEEKIDPKAPLRAPKDYRVVGQSLPRPDVLAKVTGTHPYVHDVRVPGMLHARVLRPQAIGAQLVAVDPAQIKALPDVRIVRQKNFLAVVGADEWSVVRAAQLLRPEWSGGGGLPNQDALYDYVRQSPVEKEQVLVAKGDPSMVDGRGTGGSAQYFWPVQSHASLGPSCAVADVQADSATIWTASQGTHRYHPVIARLIGLPPDRVRLIYRDGAGCYGMNGHDDAAADAALLSKMVGAPVRVQWMRADEHGWDPKGPPQIIELRGRLDPVGEINAWQSDLWLPLATAGLPTVPLLAPQEAGLDQPQGLLAGQIQQNGDPPYGIPHVRTVVHWLASTPLRPSNIRAPGKIGNSFAVECFVDEMATLAGQDPAMYRRRGLLGDARALAVLDRVITRFNWQHRPPPRPSSPQDIELQGQGIAYVHYKQAENYVAMAMDVVVNRKTGQIKVRRVVCAHDCGLIINPDALTNQIEGSILQTISRTLHEEVRFSEAGVTSTDWMTYPILRFNEVPEIIIDLIEHPDQPPFGGGEAACAPVAAALGNAVFDATGVRLRAVPFTPKAVLAELR